MSLNCDHRKREGGLKTAHHKRNEVSKSGCGRKKGSQNWSRKQTWIFENVPRREKRVSSEKGCLKNVVHIPHDLWDIAWFSSLNAIVIVLVLVVTEGK